MFDSTLEALNVRSSFVCDLPSYPTCFPTKQTIFYYRIFLAFWRTSAKLHTYLHVYMPMYMELWDLHKAELSGDGLHAPSKSPSESQTPILLNTRIFYRQVEYRSLSLLFLVTISPSTTYFNCSDIVFDATKPLRLHHLTNRKCRFD